MVKLIATRGLPGCGKSTFATAWVALDPQRRARVNRDSLRAMAHDSIHIGQTEDGPGTERAIQAVRDAAIGALLRRGVDVVCDDTNLPLRTVRELRRVALLAGAEFEVHDMTDVPLQTCLDRDAGRAGHARVGEQVIRGMWERFIRGRGKLPPLEEIFEEPPAPVAYEPVPGTPAAVMVDIDGTIALMGGRSPYDETTVLDDRPNHNVIHIVRALAAHGKKIIYCSGRTETSRSDTEKWLYEHVGVAYEALYMRQAGDQRKDSIVKLEIFDRHIRNQYRVIGVLDDRRQVVEAWRSIGLTVLQVAPGDF